MLTELNMTISLGWVVWESVIIVVVSSSSRYPVCVLLCNLRWLCTKVACDHDTSRVAFIQTEKDCAHHYPPRSSFHNRISLDGDPTARHIEIKHVVEIGWLVCLFFFLFLSFASSWVMRSMEVVRLA